MNEASGILAFYVLAGRCWRRSSGASEASTSSGCRSWRRSATGSRRTAPRCAATPASMPQNHPIHSVSSLSSYPVKGPRVLSFTGGLEGSWILGFCLRLPVITWDWAVSPPGSGCRAPLGLISTASGTDPCNARTASVSASGIEMWGLLASGWLPSRCKMVQATCPTSSDFLPVLISCQS